MKNSYTLLRLRIILSMLRRGKLTAKKVFNALHCYAAYFLRSEISAASPYLINFEMGNDCNERCVFCRTDDGEIYDANPAAGGQYIKRGRMEFGVFKDVISRVKDRLLMAIPTAVPVATSALVARSYP